jgi:lysyl-tRNA synthetase, class II
VSEHRPADEAEATDEPGGMEQLVAGRRQGAEQLRAAGLDPYPARPPRRTHTTVEAIAAFETVEAGGADSGPSDIALAGRLVGAIRKMGGSAFVHLRDGAGELQLHLRRDLLGDDGFDLFTDAYDSGDFVAPSGYMFRTRRGEPSLAVETIIPLAKSLLPLPEKWHGLKDQEARYRQRYLDLLSNPESRARAELRPRIIASMRRFLEARGFLEVETPILQPIYGGGAARPFTTHYHALDQDMYLRIADELYLKRLLVGGLERVYEIGKDFRNEGIDATHLPEFTQMECYWAYADYLDMMVLTEEMVAAIALEVLGTTLIPGTNAIDVAPPWTRLTVRTGIQTATGIDIEDAIDLDTLTQRLAARGLHLPAQPTWAKTVDKLLQHYVEPTLESPTFLLDYPAELSPLAKRKPDDSRYVERFEPFIRGMEIGNAFTELNDPLDQLSRFEEMAAQRSQGDEEAHPLDEDFVEALMHGMPPAGGLGIGVDRLVMLLSGVTNIREVVLFPQLRARG